MCTLLAGCFAGCDRRENTGATGDISASADFEPEATAITSQSNPGVGMQQSGSGNGGSGESLAALMNLGPLTTAEPDGYSTEAAVPEPEAMAVETEVMPEVEDATSEPASVVELTAEPTAEPTEEPAATPTSEPVAAQPFVTATPQPNTTISGYSEITGTGLGFKFSYPNGWQNIPGRSTICYVQPMENGTVYPARVAVTTKKLAHKCTEEKAQTELAEYIKLLMSQYDERTFEVAKDLDTDTRFMGSKAISTTYLAYDGDQEIQGYVILTWFEKYVFCYHFLCAYEDYAAFEPAIRHMRDSVQPVQSELEVDKD